MNTRIESIYQSGERVTIQGFYEVAGAPQIQRSLNTEDVFPNYDGRAVCWRLAELSQRSQAERTERASRSTRLSHAQARS